MATPLMISEWLLDRVFIIYIPENIVSITYKVPGEVAETAIFRGAIKSARKMPMMT